MIGAPALRELLRQRDFRLLWGSGLVSQTGDWMQLTAQGWLVVSITDSPTALVLVTASGLLPQLLLVLVGGVAADRFSKVSVLRGLALAQLAISAAATLVVVSGNAHVWNLALLAFLLGSCAALWQPVVLSLIPQLVPATAINSSMSLSLTALYVARSLGPVLGGVAVGTIGVGGAYFVNTLSFLAPVLAIYQLRAGAMQTGRGSRQRSLDLRPALRDLRHDGVLLPLWIMSISLSIVALPNLALIPLFAKSVLGGDARTLGWLLGALGAGQLTGAVLGSLEVHVPSRPGLAQLIGYGLQGVTLALFAIATTPTVAMIALAMFGLLHGWLSPRVNAIVQTRAHSMSRGRVQSLFLVTFGLVPIGQIALGEVVSRWGPILTVSLLGLTFTIISALVLGQATVLRQLRNIPLSVRIGETIDR